MHGRRVSKLSTRGASHPFLAEGQMKRSYRFAHYGAFAIATVSSASLSVWAQTTVPTDQFKVKVNVADSCTFTSPANFDFTAQFAGANQPHPFWGFKDRPTVFGAPKGPATAITNTMTVTCTPGTRYSINFMGDNDTISNGVRTYGVQKNMVSTETDSKILYYLRYVPSASSPRYKLDEQNNPAAVSIGTAYNLPYSGDILNTGIQETGTGKPETISITAGIDQTSWSTNPPKPGSYSDTVTIFVNY